MADTGMLATFGAATGSVSGGASWWQAVGGMLAVFALLVLCLRLLARFQRRGGRSPARVLDVWHLGPKREIQILQMGEDVHYVYRHDNAMVLLKRLSLDEHRREHGAPAAATPESPAGGWLDRARSWLPAGATPLRRLRPDASERP